MSIRKLSEKYGVGKTIIWNHCSAEGWTAARQAAKEKAKNQAVQKIADEAADNAALAEELRHKLLLRLRAIEAKYPLDATEIRRKAEGATAIFRIKDLTAAYRDLVGDMPRADAAEDTIQRAREILGRIESAIK